jgi:hypothetical protein
MRAHAPNDVDTEDCMLQRPCRGQLVTLADVEGDAR